jgi:quinol monooxygenase YgiN
MNSKSFLPLYSLVLLLLISVMIACTSASEQKNGKETRTKTLAILTKYSINKDYQEPFYKALNDYIAQALVSNNNIMAEAYYEESDSLTLWIIERWENKNGLDKIRQDAHFKTITSLAQNALLNPSQTIYVTDLEPVSKAQWRSLAAKDDKPLTIMLFVDAKPGTENNFKSVYHTAMPQFRSEPGVINYQLSQFENDSTQFVTYEKFRNEAAFQDHLHFPPIQPVIDYLNTSVKKQPFQTGLHRLITTASFKQQ